MRKVFADTSYWVAMLNPKDNLHERALVISKSLHPFYTVTSEMVLTELLNAFAERGEALRRAAISMVEKLRSASNCEIVPQTSQQFRKALERYEGRIDKGWGLTDCASFLIMEEKQMSEALTHDEHFLQAGFRALLRDPPRT